jgi:CubicO group peptidase (beta-lactamase class C family)
MAVLAQDAGLPMARPGIVGMQAEELARIEGRFKQFIADGQLSGAVTLVAKDGKLVHRQAHGLADIEAKRPMRTDTLFSIASMTKPFTATAVMILVEEGKLSLDEPVARHIPAFKDVALESGKPQSAITLRHLLTHTSGLAGNHEVAASLEQSVAAMARRPLAFEPGSQWRYAAGLSVCGRVVEVASGQTFDEFLKERIFEPLKLADTTFRPSAEQQARMARLYRPGKEPGTLEPLDNWLIDLAGERGPNPSGGLVSTARDLARFYQMILNQGELEGVRILSRRAVAEMTRLQTGERETGFASGSGWGLGWCVVREPQGVTRMLSPGSFGHGGVFGTQAWLDPQRELICILLIQRHEFGNSDASALREALQEHAVKAIE